MPDNNDAFMWKFMGVLLVLFIAFYTLAWNAGWVEVQYAETPVREWEPR